MLIPTGEAELEVAVYGDGRPVLLLHGFPDSGRLWRHQVPALVEAGFRVIVPDLRGYGGSSKPADVDAYRMRRLVADVVAVLDRLDAPRPHVVGHDWGAGLAWVLAGVAPERVDHLAVLSVGHPVSMHRVGLPQRQLSWYMLLFLFEGVAERWLTDDGWARFREWTRHPDVDAVIAELEATGALTPGLCWYRANMPAQSYVAEPALPAVAAPTMGIWSTGDFALTEEQMTGSGEFVSGPWRYERVDGAGHWMQLDAPERVNRLLLDFLPA